MEKAQGILIGNCRRHCVCDVGEDAHIGVTFLIKPHAVDKKPGVIDLQKEGATDAMAPLDF